MYLNQTNVVYICMWFREYPPAKKQKNSYIGYTTTTLSRRLTYQLSENSAIKYFIRKHNNSTNQLTSSKVRKILPDNTIIIY